MTKKLLSALIASLFAAAPAFAQSDDDPMRVQGSATVGGIYNRQNADDKAKLQEYQDLGNGALSSVGVRGRNSTTWFEGYGENFGRDDQYMFLRGGMYDVFKAGAYLNWMPHDFSTNALTPYNGVGGALLTGTFPNLDPTTWGSFNLGYQRKDAGGYFEWQKNSPWYFRVDGNQVKFDGTKVGSGALGSSPGNGYIALPIPVQYSTTNWGAEGGYQTSTATYALRWDYSHFDNSQQVLSWANPFFGGLLDATQLPPDNYFNKATATANWRNLPWNSVISARYTWAQTTSNFGVPFSQLNSFPTVPANNLTLPSDSVFHGQNVNQSFALGWTAHPITDVDTRAYYYWTKRQNKSSDIEFGNAPTMPTALGCGNVPPAPPANPTTTAWPNGNCEPDKFNYTKNDVGFDVYWRFARGQRIGAGYEYWHQDQTRVDYDEVHANTFFAEYKNTAYDTVTGRIKYRYIKRDSHHNFSDDGVSPNDPNFLLPFTSAFDMQDLTTNEVRLYLDWTPMPLLAASFEGNWARNNYNHVTFGRTDNDVQGYYLSVNWGAPDKIMVRGFGDWQQVKYPSNHRAINTISNGPPGDPSPPGFCASTGVNKNPACFDPNQQAYFSNSTTNPNSFTGSYNWSSQTKDTTWMIGVGADWPVTEQWLLNASYIYVTNNGEATFAAPCCDKNGNQFGNPIGIGNFDDTRQQYFNIKATYTLNKNWSFSGGYAYEKFSRNDVGSNGFTYLVPSPTISTPSASTSYLNGYYLNPNGNQNIFWVTVKFTFDAPPLPPAPVRVAEAPKPAPPPPPSPPAAKPAPKVEKITLNSEALFDFDKADLKPEGKAAIDSKVVGKLTNVKLEIVLVTGHTDRLGSDAYNQGLSLKRANAVRDYLVAKGIPRDKIETIGMGKKQAVVQCEQKNRKELIDCLAPNRRVDVEVKGESTAM